MCTAISYMHYFGRNLDLETDYGQYVTVIPRNLPVAGMQHHYSIIGIGIVRMGYPLLFDGTNECGLSCAALNFPGNAVYYPPKEGKNNIPSYDLISYVLSRCSSCDEAHTLLRNAVVTEERFDDTLPPTPLHWIIADNEASVVVESTKEGLQIFDNPVGLLTNNPPFPFQMTTLCNYMHVSADDVSNNIAPGIPLQAYSRGMGAMGLPGDFSSSSRFVRAVFAKYASKPNADNLSQFFHLLNYVEQVDGCVPVGEKFQKTIYSACCDTRTGIYYYTTYNNRQITAVDMRKTDLNSFSLSTFPLITEQQIRLENE